MSTNSALQSRLKELSSALAQIHSLISRLHHFTTAVGQGDEARIELSAEIHSRLKETEDDLELLKVDVDALENSADSRRKGQDLEKETEKERVIALTRRLSDDLKRTRGGFRNAQLHAKRNAETARRKERELVFSGTESAVEKRNQAKENLTQDDIVKNASMDVTAALRRTHQLMQAELSRSQFAHQTLEESSAALSTLGESYSGLDTLLTSSRNLVGSLLRSQKSDTWYLETAFYILIGTISWLVFRRLLYGPLWWIVWLPFKFILRSVFGVSAAVGVASNAVQSSAAIAMPEIPTRETPVLDHVPRAKVPGVGADAIPELVPGTDSADRDWIIDKIGEIVEENGDDSGTNLDDFSPEELQRQAEIPPNTKKRMAIMAANFFSNKARAAAAAAGSSKPKPSGKEEQPRQQPWVEKYRPKTLDDVAAQDHTTKVLQRTLQASNLPHMLFYGPPGTGKTSTILALAKSLFGPALYRSRILELNASDERGIGIVREKVKGFARVQLSHPTGLDASYFEKYPCPPFKIIILDEADSMTQDAQSALRRTMEQYSRITRFCLVCNYVTRIIEPLASRCSKFRFKPLDNSAAGDRLAQIAQMENLSLEDGVVDKLISCSDGDLRRAITYMQSAARLVGAAKPGAKDGDDDDEMKDQGSETITIRTIEEIAGVIPESILDQLIQAVQPKKLGSSYEAVSKVVTDIVADGWSATQLLVQLYRRMVYNDAIPDIQKNKIVMVFSEMDKRLVDGADEHLSILDVALKISGILGGS
ncbi:P-loop containing nucleoside triphosphate hydrolase protein [Aspergillus pseudoustus]|uniref:P-loop containing nucleoside triphosphate hydrolase protein n=1 Tax=Aspergillus pseudoustus TaxID=1810923 RepID=A0ABR4K3P0_9EURO